MIVFNLMEDRSVFTPRDGTFRINNLNWSDGAEYNLIITDSKGKESEQRTLQLSIQAPVSSVRLASECLSQGEMRVSCSSEGGDSPQYSWTLDGHTLTDDQLLSGSKETNIITLKQDVSGLLVCSVRNHISSVSKEEKISTCGFIFINCTSSNGTNISQWVYEANNTLCIEPTTTPVMITDLKTSTVAPVSSVRLASECLSQGEMRVSCSSEGGDSPQYSWTLDEHTLTDDQLLSGSKETNIITLKQDVSGLLVCSVRNHISNVSKEEKISTCGFIFINCTSSNGTNISQWVYEANNTLCIEPTTTPIMITDPKTSTEDHLPVIGGVLAALMILLIIGVAVVCSQRKKQSNKPKEEEDGQELTYAEVNIVQRQRRQMHQREETEVEYGQVKFSRRPQSSVVPTQDECVYSQVRKNR
ncbi:uncharacterized protein LOC133985605 [Scomber scombrus]|uniref:uncharacterized protein LOC133985605 n=1 Tax=Scomber scombrus TaxID=13677 RepID=UPI002DD90736|nr:uncharacterized protein LOC133985605 [Scomber scombrus]